ADWRCDAGWPGTRSGSGRQHRPLSVIWPPNMAAPWGASAPSSTRRTDGLDRSCAVLLQLPVDWAEQQFRQMGRRDARDLAVALIASYQGVSLLTNTFRDQELMHREGRRLEHWIDSLA